MLQSRHCSSSGELLPQGGERGGGGGGGGGGGRGGRGEGGAAFKSKLEIKSSHSSHQRLLGSSSVTPQLLICFGFCNRRAITFHSHRCTGGPAPDKAVKFKMILSLKAG